MNTNDINTNQNGMNSTTNPMGSPVPPTSPNPNMQAEPIVPNVENVAPAAEPVAPVTPMAPVDAPTAPTMSAPSEPVMGEAAPAAPAFTIPDVTSNPVTPEPSMVQPPVTPEVPVNANVNTFSQPMAGDMNVGSAPVSPMAPIDATPVAPTMSAPSEPAQTAPIMASMDPNNMGAANPLGADSAPVNPMGPTLDLNQNIPNNMFNASPNMGMPNNTITPNVPNGNFGAVPTPPPAGDGGKKKASIKLSKPMIIVLVAVLVCAVGAGVYFVLNGSTSSKPAGNIATNQLFFELGDELPTDVSEYATITGFDVSACKVDTSSVDTTKMNTYSYTVTCGTMQQTGTIAMRDTTAPEVVVQDVMVVPNSLITIDDFIVACNDFTECSYELVDKTLNLSNLAATEGTYTIDLIASDDYDNQTNVTLHLTVSSLAPVRYTNCTMTPVQDTDLNALSTTSYNYGINMNDEVARTEKTVVYTFDEKDDYLKVKEAYTPTTGINGMVGAVVFDDLEFEITVTSVLTDQQLAVEFNVNPFPTTYEELSQFNLGQGFSCINR